MIIVRLQGGLGNQMFQYAVGRSLAHFRNTSLKLDDSFLRDRTPREDFTYRDYELNIFKLNGAMAGEKELKPFFAKPSGFLEKVSHLLREVLQPHQVFRQRFFHYDDQFFNCKRNTYLDGYWQSYKYFEPIEEIIRNDFQFKAAPIGKNANLINKLTKEQSVSVHVRRGDYVKHKRANLHHGVCPVEYYQSAMQYVAARVEGAHFYFFSDDIEWVKQNLGKTYQVSYVSHNTGGASFEDMRMMSYCKHNITANSSFSWWGAWLNSNPGKYVIAPEQWFNDTSRDTQDLTPQNWIRL